MKVKLKYEVPQMRKITEKRGETIEITREVKLENIIKILEKKYGPKFRIYTLLPTTAIFLNNKNIENLDGDITLEENSRIVFATLSGGG